MFYIKINKKNNFKKNGESAKLLLINHFASDDFVIKSDDNYKYIIIDDNYFCFLNFKNVKKNIKSGYNLILRKREK